ncbi:MAG TPA: PQQ-dependent dehydrogenase, methanol/ethanol family [Myxococcota bacterium]|nr:PQQ-dependent dehydrogenase, methanol/ethanol family [Myxococcota bacterium]
MRRLLAPACASLLLLAGACAREAPDPDAALRARIQTATAAVDDARLRDADADVANWLTHGRTYAEQRMSPLDQIDATNVAGLGLAWSLELGTNRGVEATPIVVDGVLFATGPWSVVYAVDARTGRLLWRHDPQVPRRYGRIACCDVVNRGVALYRGTVYSGTLDGRLLALDAATGAKRWEVVTVDPARPYTITGAPRIVAGRVILGNGGAELGVRGYVSAYDPDDGALVWRTYTVPGDPAQPFESPALERAATTWSGEWWKAGGGGTAWDSMAYDPELDLLYVGTGNGSPWARRHRSPGGGDNLYLSSVLALRPATGELVWHYQTTPGDNWDYTATQHMVLAELAIDGRLRKVLMQAPKNGFFYVLDRATGELLAADPYVKVSWASGVDLATGRPTETREADYGREAAFIWPSPLGGHNWQPMSFNPGTGLVYVPVNDLPGAHAIDPRWRHRPASWNTGTALDANLDIPDGWSEMVQGRLIAWDPVAQREVWRAPHVTAWNGGTLTTAGNLVFEGTADGRFVAYRASDGAQLWEAEAGTGVMAAPVTYLVDGEQFVTVLAGWGGAYPLAYGEAGARAGVTSVGRVLTFKLGGTAQLPPAIPYVGTPAAPPFAVTASAAELREGGIAYHEWCAVCHGLKAVGGGVVPDLRRADPETHARWNDIVLGGTREEQGMVSFADVLDARQSLLIQQYVVQRVWETQPARAATP